jgi:hypothetical protein
MNLPRITLAVFAWAGVTISSASNANALACTSQSGEYALCGGYSALASYEDCAANPYGYAQQIKFSTLGCGSGACQEDGHVYTQNVYGAGRKIATHTGTCPYNDIYGLGSCDC